MSDVITASLSSFADEAVRNCPSWMTVFAIECRARSVFNVSERIIEAVATTVVQVQLFSTVRWASLFSKAVDISFTVTWK